MRMFPLIKIYPVIILVIMSTGNAAGIIPLVQSNSTRYGLSTLLALGNFGTICNIVIFSSSRTHRANSCSLYLLASACFNLLAINLGLAPILYSLDHQDPAIVSEIFCKAKVYAIHIVFNSSRWLVVLACADRFCRVPYASTHSLMEFASVRTPSDCIGYVSVANYRSSCAHLARYSPRRLWPIRLVCACMGNLSVSYRGVFSTLAHDRLWHSYHQKLTFHSLTHADGSQRHGHSITATRY